MEYLSIFKHEFRSDSQTVRQSDNLNLQPAAKLRYFRLQFVQIAPEFAHELLK